MYEAALKFLASIKTITTSDAKRLLGAFGSISAIAKCSADRLNSCPGLGQVKCQRLHDFFNSDILLPAKSKKAGQ